MTDQNIGSRASTPNYGGKFFSGNHLGSLVPSLRLRNPAEVQPWWGSMAMF
ncbi:MAG: hypothetical protein F6K42_07455 [Leptolyngbya sp. SIO1D8]|nr:hypothetical protein [Leptolyngbya sp. SIO1D8]